MLNNAEYLSSVFLSGKYGTIKSKTSIADYQVD